MTRFIVDSWAWMEYLQGSPAGAKLRDHLNDASNDFLTHAVTLAEIISKVRRRGKDPDMAWKIITAPGKPLKSGSPVSTFAPIFLDDERTKASARLKLEFFDFISA